MYPYTCCAKVQTCHVNKSKLMQIHTTKQAAVAMAAAYPSLLSQTMLEQAAIDRGYPPLSDIINQKAPPLEILNWNHVNMYVRMINVHNMFTYVPFLPSVRTRLLCPTLTPP